MVEKIKHYFREELWNFPLSQESGWRRFWIKWTRIAYLAGRGFYRDKCSLGASSLTYYTLMSIVPVLAMAFAIARGFGYNDRLRLELLQRFQDQNEALVEIFKYADAFLEQARGGVIAGFGLLVLFLTVVLLLSNLEGILNQIWGVKNLRPWRRIVIDYLALILIAPVMFVAASSMAVFVVDQFEIGIRILPIASWAISWLLFLVNLIPYGLFWILFTFIYQFMPNTKVRFRSACLAGIFTACLYVVVQWGYIHFQIGVSRYGAIYGSMAALPLFLVWIQLSWFLFLFGAEISHVHQTLAEHEFEARALKASDRFKRSLALWIAYLALKRGLLTKRDLMETECIPAALVNPALQRLVDARILFEAKGGYVPAHSLFEMRISDLLEALESRGESNFPTIDSQKIAPFQKILEEFQKQIESTPLNTRLNHVSDPL